MQLSTYLLAILITLVTCAVSAGNPVTSQLEPLRAGIGDKETKEKLTIAMIYQPDCSWCKKQGVSLSQIHHNCQKTVDVNLIGFRGNKRQLKHELKHFDKQLPAYSANRKFISNVGGISASPTLLFFDQQGKLLAKRKGYVESQKLFKAIQQATDNQCSIG